MLPELLATTNCPPSLRGTHATAVQRAVESAAAAPSGLSVHTATGLAGAPLACRLALNDMSITAAGLLVSQCVPMHVSRQRPAQSRTRAGGGVEGVGGGGEA